MEQKQPTGTQLAYRITREVGKAVLVPLTLFVAPEVLAAIDRIASREDRSRSQVGHRLLRKALKKNWSHPRRDVESESQAVDVEPAILASTRRVESR